MASVNQTLIDRAIRHAVYLVRLQNGEANAVLRLLNEAIPDIDNSIQSRLLKIKHKGGSALSSSTVNHLQAMKATLQDQVSAIKLLSHLREKLLHLASTEAEYQATILRAAVPADITVAFRQPTAALLRSIVTSRPFEGQVLSQWTQNAKTSIVNRVTRSINIGLTRGEDIRSISQRVRDQLNTTKHEAVAITRTAVNHVSAQAREATYGENADFIKGVQFIATLDHRTTLTCASLDGQIFPLEEGPRPPMHFNCRSTTVPVLKSWEELGIPAKSLKDSTRASMNGEVSNKVTFGDWIKAQPTGIQNEVLGPSRADLLRKGKSIDRFVDDKFRPLTLSKLRELELGA